MLTPYELTISRLMSSVVSFTLCKSRTDGPRAAFDQRRRCNFSQPVGLPQTFSLIGRHLQVHVIAGQKFASLSARDELGRKLASTSALELIAERDTNAKQAVAREGLLDMARKRLAALAR
jgi:hypothetical protein